MNKTANFMHDVTLLVTHFNRSCSLEKLLARFTELQCSFGEIIVSDDGSQAEHISYLENLQEIYPFRLITSDKNRGLGNNINKGQDAVVTPYTLYVQEDLHPTNTFADLLPAALNIMKQRTDIDLVRFFAYFKYPYLKAFNNDFSEMTFDLWNPGYYKFYLYSDSSHLRRSNFFQKFGRYKEGTNSDDAEYRMCLSFLKENGKALLANDFNKLFEHANTEQEPSTADFRKEWRNRKTWAIKLLRAAYLQFKSFKYHYDFLFHKPIKQNFE